MIMVWWIQLSRIIHPAVSPLWIYCVSGDGRCWWILFSRGSPGSKGRGELYSRMVGGSLSLVEGSLGSDGCYGREWWPGSMPGEEGGTAAATRTGTTHNTRLQILRTRQNTAAHTESSTHSLGEDQLQQLCISWLRTCQIKQDASCPILGKINTY